MNRAWVGSLGLKSVDVTEQFVESCKMALKGKRLRPARKIWSWFLPTVRTSLVPTRECLEHTADVLVGTRCLLLALVQPL